MKESATPIDAYADTVGARKQLIKLAGDKLPGRSAPQVADAVLMVTELENPPLHLLLGHDVLAAFRQKLAELRLDRRVGGDHEGRRLPFKYYRVTSSREVPVRPRFPVIESVGDSAAAILVPRRVSPRFMTL